MAHRNKESNTYSFLLCIFYNRNGIHSFVLEPGIFYQTVHKIIQTWHDFIREYGIGCICKNKIFTHILYPKTIFQVMNASRSECQVPERHPGAFGFSVIEKISYYSLESSPHHCRHGAMISVGLNLLREFCHPGYAEKPGVFDGKLNNDHICPNLTGLWQKCENRWSFGSHYVYHSNTSS